MTEPPPPSKLTTSKQRWADEHRFLTGRLARAASERLPPGQHLVQTWPVLDLGVQPRVATTEWSLRVYGRVRHPFTWDWTSFRAQEQQETLSDIHCVTTWSRYDNAWEGVATRTLLGAAEPMDDARYVMLHSHDGYTTNLPLSDFADPGALLAHSWQGSPLSKEHGGPVRLVVPHLYFWKSAKWLARIEFRTSDAPGYWEQLGYHERGDPWTEQRYSD